MAYRRSVCTGAGRQRRDSRHDRRADLPRDPRISNLRWTDRGPQMVARQKDQARPSQRTSMSTGETENVGTVPVREAHRFDEAALARWMAANVADYAGPLTVEQFKGGQSNPTYKLLTPGRSYALRRKPPGQLLKGAHAVDREARVMTALGKMGFPVPRIFGVCTDDSVIGTW